MKITGIIIVMIISFALSTKVYSQEFSKNSLKFGYGVGVSMGEHTAGFGTLISIGYQRNIWKDRLRINPNLTFGTFSSKFVLDAGDQWFNPVALETILYYDLIRIQTVSLTVGLGAMINNTQGYIGPSGYNSSPSSYVNDWSLGGYMGAGIRICPAKGRLAFEVMPINWHIGTNNLAEAYAKIGMEIKL